MTFPPAEIGSTLAGTKACKECGYEFYNYDGTPADVDDDDDGSGRRPKKSPRKEPTVREPPRAKG